MERRSVHPALAWALVAVQFVLLVGLALAPRGELWQRSATVLAIALAFVAAGVVVAVVAGAGLGRALTPSPIPREGGELTTSGVYALVRHPIYSGLILLGMGLAIIGASWMHVVLLVALVALLSAKARVEERMLLARFPAYAEYAARVGRLAPGLGRLR
jgi:protein-S-isoprenylcysteine O-methyltransferase Ste14